MTIFLSGIAGFIGFYTAKKLVERGDTVIGLDNLNNYYSTELKTDRLSELGISKKQADSSDLNQISKSLYYVKSDINNFDTLNKIFIDHKIDAVCHLAAQAGVRYSLENPHEYARSNLNGFLNILEICRKFPVKHLVYASSSSVYGLNETIPFKETDTVDHPVSLYAASKKSNELMAHSYSHLYNIPTTGLRFFTVYGPWGRPDMAPMLFSKSIMEHSEIQIFNKGEMYRDFTFVGDIVEGIIKIIDCPAKPDKNWTGKSPDSSSSKASYRILNIGNSKPVHLLKFVTTLEDELGKKARKLLKPMQPGDVEKTWADTSALENLVGYKPSTDLKKGISLFAQWYKEYYSC